VTNSSGQVSTSLTCVNPGTAIVFALDSGLPFKDATVACVPGPPVLAGFAVAVSPTLQVADGSSAVTATATVRDQLGNPVPGASVALASTDPVADSVTCPPAASGCAAATGPATGVVATTDASGVAAALVRSSAAGSRNLSATTLIAGSPASVTAAASWIPGAPAQLAFVQVPASASAGVTIQPGVQVAVRDAAGNLVPTASGTVSLALAGGGTLGGTTTSDVSRGSATFNSVRVEGFTGTTALTATASGLAPATSATFPVSP
jgi:hypothetical protein